MSRGFANMVVQMAFDQTVLSSSGKSVNKQAHSIQTKASRHAPTR
jgi:hypothetical protein